MTKDHGDHGSIADYDRTNLKLDLLSRARDILLDKFQAQKDKNYARGDNDMKDLSDKAPTAAQIIAVATELEEFFK